MLTAAILEKAEHAGGVVEKPWKADPEASWFVSNHTREQHYLTALCFNQ